jgi:16S rRNA (cytosine967-C5)-methyltransferase
VGAYQLAFLATPAHAAGDATGGAVRGRGRSVVNAVLRRVARAPVEYPDLATELSYPDWIVDRLSADLGSEPALAALAAMNEPAPVTVREDGYTQDEASQLVVTAVGALPGDLVVDLCAAPGGKATGLAAAGAAVVAGDVRPKRARLLAANARDLGAEVRPVVADGNRPPLRPGSVDRVLVDAPCSGLGSLRRRADARWRVDPAAPERLAELQAGLVLAGLDLLRPGGTLTYSVCTLTGVESTGVLEAALARSAATVVAPPGPPWVAGGGGVATLLPSGTDGMMLFTLRSPA